MDFKWYEQIKNSVEITQGDILTNCTILVPNTAVYDALLNDKEEVEEPLAIRSSDLIILSQACDIENQKIDELVLCPIWPLEKLIEINPHYKSSKARDSLRQGKEPAYHLLNKNESEDFPMDYSVVDFRQIFTLPKDYLKRIAGDIKIRLRLLPPYREHLSQAFARYFMRVGLPSDISADEIKEYKKIAP